MFSFSPRHHRFGHQRSQLLCLDSTSKLGVSSTLWIIRVALQINQASATKREGNDPVQESMVQVRRYFLNLPFNLSSIVD